MKHKWLIPAALFLILYAGSYLVLSLLGSYMPATYGSNGIKDWDWTPLGFSDDTGRLRAGIVIPYFPLFWIDKFYWHNDWSGSNGPRRMPIRPITGTI